MTHYLILRKSGTTNWVATGACGWWSPVINDQRTAIQAYQAHNKAVT